MDINWLVPKSPGLNPDLLNDIKILNMPLYSNHLKFFRS